jgi:hypothetical protein
MNSSCGWLGSCSFRAENVVALSNLTWMAGKRTSLKAFGEALASMQLARNTYAGSGWRRGRVFRGARRTEAQNGKSAAKRAL